MIDLEDIPEGPLRDFVRHILEDGEDKSYLLGSLDAGWVRDNVEKRLPETELHIESDDDCASFFSEGPNVSITVSSGRDIATANIPQEHIAGLIEWLDEVPNT